MTEAPCRAMHNKFPQKILALIRSCRYKILMGPQTDQKADATTSSGHQTACKAGKILEATGEGFFIPTQKQRQDLLIECATRGYASYARAFDILKVTKQGLDPQNIQIKSDFDSLRICEIKSTNRDLRQDWSGYFFSLSTAELLIAQSLKERFRFVLVNTRTGSHLELTLTEVFARARAIYPSWSVRF